MDRQLLERMIGAGVLIVALVLIAPAILDGRRDSGIATYSTGGSGEVGGSGAAMPDASGHGPEMRTHTIVLDREPESPPVARPLVESARVESARDESASAESTGAESPAATKPRQASAKPAASPVAEVSSPAPVIADQAVVEQTKAAPGNSNRVAPKAVASGWSVQLGSFTERPNAERLAGEVKSRGFSAYLESLNQAGRTYYRVRVGPRPTREQASELAGGLAKAGYTGQVVQQQPAP